MGADILTMDGVTPPKKERGRRSSWRAEDRTARYLFMATNAQGQTSYYFRIHITGMRDRIFGPYARRYMAIEGFDLVLDAAYSVFCDVQNHGRNGGDGMEHSVLPRLTPVSMR